MLPEKDDDGRQVFFLRPGNYYAVFHEDHFLLNVFTRAAAASTSNATIESSVRLPRWSCIKSNKARITIF